MRFGLFGSAQARRSGPDTDSSQGFREFIDNNVEAEALGYYSTFLVEHHFTGFGQVSASLNLLTWLGARTRHLRLGTAVLVLPWHNPVLLAEQAATLHLLSGGRLDFGVGKGYRYNEFAGFCLPMEEADSPFEESLEIITKAFTAETPFSFRGKFWQFDKIIVEPPTAQKPHPPFWMGAGSPSSVRQVADDIAFPNGMAVTADNSTLIIAESFAGKLTAYDIALHGSLGNRRIWADVFSDGICIDAEGAVWGPSWLDGRPGCMRVAEGGQVRQWVETDRACFACTLGGEDGTTLFMLAADWHMNEGFANNLERLTTGPRTGQLLTAEVSVPGAGWP